MRKGNEASSWGITLLRASTAGTPALSSSRTFRNERLLINYNTIKHNSIHYIKSSPGESRRLWGPLQSLRGTSAGTRPRPEAGRHEDAEEAGVGITRLS